MTNDPHPIPQIILNRDGASDGMTLSFMIAIGFSLLPASIISHAIQERNSGLKHQQLISGMNIFAYWTANYIFEIIKTELPILLSLGLVYAFDEGLPMVWRTFLLLPVGLVPFTFGISFFFGQDSSAKSTVMFVNFVIAGLGGIAVFILSIISQTYYVADILTYVFRLVPIFSVTHTINFQSTKQAYEFLRPEMDLDDWRWIHSGGDIAFLCLHFIFWSIFIALAEMPALKKLNW